MGFSELGDGRAATGSPDAFDIDAQGNEVPGQWAANLSPSAVATVLENQMDSAWLGTQSGSLAPVSMTTAGVPAWRDLDILQAKRGGVDVKTLLIFGGLALVLAAK